MFFAQKYDVADRAGQVERYLRMLGLWERRHEPVGGFSKEMRQKLAIARALLHEPKALFLDEPTSGLDPQAARAMRQFIADLKSDGRTIVLCTHNLDEADRLCDRVAEQISAIFILPIIGLFVGQSTGLIFINERIILWMVLGLLVLDAGLFAFALQLFQRESILTRWK